MSTCSEVESQISVRLWGGLQMAEMLHQNIKHVICNVYFCLNQNLSFLFFP